MNTDLIYPKTTIDDACDWTPVIVWRMNAGARARSRSVFVPCPQPQSILGITPKFKAPKKVKSQAKKIEKKKTSGISAQQLVAIMKGKTLSHQGILKAIEKHYPDIKITAHHLRKRIDCMLSSNHVGITKHDDAPITYFTLQSVDPKFYALSEKAMRA